MNPKLPFKPSRETLAKARVLVVGDVMLDRYWHGSVERISPEAPVPVLNVQREEERIGAAANVAFNVVKLGAQASLLSVVGEDEPGRQLRALLAATQIKPILASDPTLKTTVKLRLIGRHQQLMRVDFENLPDHEVLGDMLSAFEAALPEHDLVLFSDYGKGGLTHVARMIELAKARGLRVLVDPKGSDYSRYSGASLITPNRTEFAQVAGVALTEVEFLAKAARLRESLGIDALLVTRSEEGMSLFDAAGHDHVPTQAREVFDVTGAGDTVIGTLAACMAAGAPLRDAVRVANFAAGIVVAKFGTATASYEEVFEA